MTSPESMDIGSLPSTAALSDAMDRFGIECAVIGIAPAVPGWRIAGPAFTVKYAPTTSLSEGNVGDYIDDVQPGSVIVLDNSGRTDCTVWGGILTSVAASRGVSGVVINGVCRDVSESIRLGFPVFSKGRFMRTGKDRVEAVEVNGAVELSGLRVEPGDIVIGDDDGVVVVPRRRWAEVRGAAREIDRIEGEIEDAVRDGALLSEARERFGYHRLQRGGG